MTPRTVSWLAVAGLVVYFVLFYAAEMPSLTQATGKTFRRAELLVHYLLLPEELLGIWCGHPPEFSLADRLPILVLAGGILAWAVAAGWLLLKLIGADRSLTGGETLVFAAAVGLNAVSTFVLAAGLLGWLEWGWMVAPAAATLLAAAWLWIREKSRRRAHDAGVPCGPTHPADDPPKGPAWRQLLVRSGWAMFVAVLLLGAMLPPIDFDVREYHLQAPKEFYLQESIGFLPHNVYANMPLGAEMLSLLGMVLADDWWLGALAGKTVLASYAVLTALALQAAGCRLACRRAGVVASLVYISIPWVVQVSTLGLVDAALGCYLFLAFYAFWLAVGRSCPESMKTNATAAPPHGKRLAAGEQRGMMMLAGYLAGGAVSSKYPGILYVVMPLAIWIFVSRGGATPRCWRQAWRPLGAFLVAAAVGCGLWLAKNWALTGNPTYPLLYSVFDGKTRTPEKDRQWNAVHRPRDFSLRTLGNDLARVAINSEWLSPLVVPLAALAFLASSRRRLAWELGAYVAFLFAAWWLLTHRIDRFWMPALPLFALLAGVGAAWSQERPWRIALTVFLVVGSVANFLTIASVGGGYNPYFVSLARLREDPQRVDPWHRYFNRHAPDGRVLLVGDAQPFDLEMPVFYNTCFDDSIFQQVAEGRSPRAVHLALIERGITHVYVHWGEIERYRGTYGFTDFVQPAVFESLVNNGVLVALPAIADHSGRAYRVAPRAE